MDFEKARVNDEKLLTEVGRLAVSWASLEFALDALILVIYRGGYSEHEPELPRALNRKIEFLRGAFKRAMTADVLANHLAFLDKVKTESGTRHDIIHGFPVHHPSDEGESKIIRLLIQKSGWEQRETIITAASVNEAANRAYALAGTARRAAMNLADRYFEDVAERDLQFEEPPA